MSNIAVNVGPLSMRDLSTLLWITLLNARQCDAPERASRALSTVCLFLWH
jgi:hypothetical protein